MVSMIGIRPNHYQALGLEPGASDDEIKRGFARRMGLFPSPADAALIGIAYETLRNPAKRRAYDQSLGLGGVTKRSPMAVSFAGSARFSGLAPRDIAPAERKPLPFIAAPKPDEPRPEERLAQPVARPAIIQPAAIEPDADADVRPTGWNRAAMAVGGLVFGVALIGAWAGSQAGSAEEPQPPARSVRVTLPPPKIVAQNDPAPLVEPRPTITASPTRRVPPPQHPAQRGDRLAEVSKAIQSAGDSDETASPPAAATAPKSSLVETAAASLPLSNATIARTIERIGYACGEVTSTAAQDGAAGVYTVSCTSGQSYQAKPVHGRYRFRRLP